jgi:hypothetical protein
MVYSQPMCASTNHVMGLVLVALFSMPARIQGQVQKAEEPSALTQVIAVTMCDLWEFPNKYAGKMVQVRATAMSGDISNLWIEGFGCKPSQGYMHTLAVLPEQVEPEPDFAVVVDDSFIAFRSAIKTKIVQATFVGLFQSVFVWHEQKRLRVGSGEGFGKKNEYDARLVLRSISDVKALPRMPH